MQTTGLFFLTLFLLNASLYGSYYSKQKYYKNIIINSFNIYPECEIISYVLDKYISNSKSSDLYKTNKISSVLSFYSKESCMFLMDILDREISNSKSVRDSLIFLLFGAIIGNGFFKLSNDLTAIEYIFTTIFSIIILSLIYLLFYFIIDATFYEPTEVKKYNILKKYTDLSN